MGRRTVAAVAKSGFTPRTAEATFVITALDVGGTAVRPGWMADLEHERNTLLAATRLVLGRLKAGQPVEAPYQEALEVAVRMAEAGGHS
jgi:hypothetical protein